MDLPPGIENKLEQLIGEWKLQVQERFGEPGVEAVDVLLRLQQQYAKAIKDTNYGGPSDVLSTLVNQALDMVNEGDNGRIFRQYDGQFPQTPSDRFTVDKHEKFSQKHRELYPTGQDFLNDVIRRQETRTVLLPSGNRLDSRKPAETGGMLHPESWDFITGLGMDAKNIPQSRETKTYPVPQAEGVSLLVKKDWEERLKVDGIEITNPLMIAVVDDMTRMNLPLMSEIKSECAKQFGR